MTPIVQTEKLSKTYITKQRKGLFKSTKRPVKALQGISLEVQPGEVFGLLGPNGAGKTTLIKILTTLLLPTYGEAWINGYNVLKEENKVRASVGCMLMGERGLYWKLTGRENLRYFGALYHLSAKERERRAEEILKLLDMEDLANRTVETYSSGQKMKLAFGKALINDAPLLILDEPTNTLDVPSASELRAIVRQLNQRGKTVIYTTHIMAEAETLCNRVAIIDYGKLLALGTVDELKASLGRNHVVRVEGIISRKALEATQALPQVAQATLTSKEGLGLLNVVAQNGTNILPVLIDTLTQHKATIQKIEPEEVTLEDVFITKTGRTLAEDTREK
ncbi:MAG: ATP-binding cassette domain-containing protein [Anaerolineales bacterium]|jgi:ABC-2 type transport system ATP-binding protein